MDTRERIIDATLDSLARNGYAGTTARVIATLASVPVGLIFYHFATLDSLLLAVLDHTSAARLPRWEEALGVVRDPTDLMHIMGELYAEDMASGHALAVRELVSNGGLSTRLGAEIAARMEPWFALAEDVAARAARLASFGPHPCTRPRSHRSRAVSRPRHRVPARWDEHLRSHACCRG